MEEAEKKVPRTRDLKLEGYTGKAGHIQMGRKIVERWFNKEV